MAVAHVIAADSPGRAPAHPLADGRVVVLERSLAAAGTALGTDGDAYQRLIGRTVEDWGRLVPAILGPLVRAPRHPVSLTRFGLPALRSAARLATTEFSAEPTRALFAGAAAHSILPLERMGSASFGLVMLALAHVQGWPIARG